MRFLGFPIGSPTFIASYLQQVLDTYRTNIKQLTTRIHDRQTQAQLFRSSAIPSIHFYLPADVYYHIDTADIDNAPFIHDWNSPFTAEVQHIHDSFLQHISNTKEPLPPLASAIAALPASQGGLGLRDASVAAIPALIVPLISSIRLASVGLSLPNHSDASPPAPLCDPLLEWPTSDSRLATIFRHYLEELSNVLFDQPRTDFILHDINLNGLQKELYAKHQESLHKRLSSLAADTTTATLLPSILNPITSIALHSLPHFHPSNRLPTDLYTILLCRKLRLPLQLPTTCLCNKPLDVYGDHLFSCRRISAKLLHNAIRDSLYHVLARLGPLSGLVSHPTDIHLEPTNLLPDHPHDARPADVGVSLAPTPIAIEPLPQHYVAIDVTTVNPVPSTPPARPPTLASATTRIHKAHHAGARRKFIHEPDVSLLNEAGILLLPFTFDSFGSPGYFARRLLVPQASSQLPPAPKPPWTDNKLSASSRAHAHPSALTAFQNALHPSLPSAILPLADRWWIANYPSRKFGDSFHTSLPSQWAIQSLALNISVALATHASKSASMLAQAATQTIQASFDLSPPPHPPLPFRAAGPTACDALFPSDFSPL